MAEENKPGDVQVAADGTALAAIPTGEEAAPKKSKLPLIIGLVVVALIIVGGGAAGWMWWQAKKKAKEEEENLIENRLKAQMDARKQPSAPVFVPLDEFLVNLPSRGGEHFLSTTMVLRVADSKTEGKVKDFLPLIRDRVLTVLSSRPMEQLSTVEGKDLMARECALVINAIIEPQLTAIYVLQQDATTADLRNLERIGVMTPGGRAYGGTSAGERVGDAAKEAAAQFWKVTEMDLPVQAVLFNKFVMQ